MDPLVSILALILLALLGARFSFSTETVAEGPRLLFRTGLHFLLIGFLLGPEALGFVTREAADQFTPLLGLGLGWIGIHFGLQLDRTSIARFPKGYAASAILQAAISFAVILGVGLLVANLLGYESDAVRLGVLGLAATGSVTAPAGVAMVSANFRARGRVRELLFFIASVDGVVGIVALAAIYAGFHGSTAVVEAPDFAPWWFWDLATVGLAVLCAVLLLWLTRLGPRREELVLFLLGISALASGAALQLQLSPLFIGTAVGAMVANTSRYHQRIYQTMARWEQPIYMILLLLAGAFLRFPTWVVLPLALGFAVVRFGAKTLAGAVVAAGVPLPFRPPRRLGLALLPQGGIVLAMALSLTLFLRESDPTVGDAAVLDLLFGVIVLGVVLSDLVGPILTTAVLRAAGELQIEPGTNGQVS